MEIYCKIFYYVVSPLVTIWACCFGYVFTKRYISKDKQVEINHAELKDTRELFMTTSLIISSRIYDFNRVLWAIEDIKSTEDITDKIVSDMNNERKIYKETLRYYNINVRRINKQILYVYGKDISEYFLLDDEFDNKFSDNPKSIAGKFTKTHYMLNNLIKNILSNKNINYIGTINELKKERNDLSLDINIFIDKISQYTYSKKDVNLSSRCTCQI